MASILAKLGQDMLEKRLKYFFFVPVTVSPDPSKSIPKKIVKNCYSSIISSQIGPGQAKNELKKCLFQEPFLPYLGWSFPKKNQNNSKKNKNIILASFNAKPGQDRLKMR